MISLEVQNIIHSANRVIYEFQTYPIEGIVCHADNKMFFARYDLTELKKGWIELEYQYPVDQSLLADSEVLTDTKFLQQQFEVSHIEEIEE